MQCTGATRTAASVRGPIGSGAGGVDRCRHRRVPWCDIVRRRYARCGLRRPGAGARVGGRRRSGGELGGRSGSQFQDLSGQGVGALGQVFVQCALARADLGGQRSVVCVMPS